MPPNDERRAGEVGATRTAFAIVEQLQGDEGTGVSALASRLDLSKSTVHSHLQTLQNLGYVVKEDGEYRLGLRFLGLGDRARQRHNLYHVAKPEADSLVEAVGERAQVMVEENAVGIYIYQSLADQAVRTDSHIGTVVDLHATSVGKAYLAHLPDDDLDRILDTAELSEQTPDTLTDRDTLRAELDEIAERGYAFNDEERTVGMRAVGAPILSDDDRVLGGISVSGPTTRMNGSWYREEVPDMVTQSARVIGIKATYS
jgi:DNA-binding IclR family transcriptional regulator